MSIATIVCVALSISGLTYLTLAWRMHKRSKDLGDQIPLIGLKRQARVQNSQEFSAATVATTISLATVILAYTELAGYMGTWLYWTVITTACGIFVVRITSPFIWKKIMEKGAWRPTLHEFLGTSYNSTLLVRGAALCTSLGFIGALAVELTVGSKFLTGLVPSVPPWLALVIISGIGVTYTMLGGFRMVIVSDRIQMYAIWLTIIALIILIILNISDAGGTSFLMNKMPATIYNFSWRAGLGAFLIGIAVINIPTFLADMSIWQRIAASRDEETVKRGLRGSVISAAVSWGALATIACLLVAVIIPKEGENPLLTFILQAGASQSGFIGIMLIIVIVGLYAASLSTASTQLIAAGHALHTDLIRGSSDKSVLANSHKELVISRWILVVSASVAVFIVQLLTTIGFSIADLVFAVFGAQLGMVPVVIAALIFPKDLLNKISFFATLGVLLGFAAGWASAGYGKLIANPDLVFLSPVISLITCILILLIGLLVNYPSWRKAVDNQQGK